MASLPITRADDMACGMTRRRHYLPRQRDDLEKESMIGEYRVAQGLTIRELCDKAGVSQGMYSGLASGIISPLYEKIKGRGIKPAAQAICDVLDIEFADAFPRYTCKLDESHGFVFEQMEGFIVGSYGGWAVDEYGIQEGLRKLKPRELEVVWLRYHEDLTLDEIADTLGVSRERIRQIEAFALRKIRGAVSDLTGKAI